MTDKNNMTHGFDVTRLIDDTFGANEFLFNSSINKETKHRICHKQSPSKIQGLANIPACQQSSNVPVFQLIHV